MEMSQETLYEPLMDMRDRIKLVMGQMKQNEFAKLIGVSPQAVNQWLKGNANPSAETLKIISEKRQVDLAWLTLGTDTVISEASGNLTGRMVFGERDLPVFAAVEGGPGELVVSTDPIELVPRPWYLGEVRNGYAVYVTGESMVPVYEPGDMLIINPRLPYMRGKDHIFTTLTEDGQFRATVKRLVSVTEKEWKVQQFNPPRTFGLPRSVWVEARRIVGKYTG
jgi:phage repressor protein C with HTH and peptisase S24 domain